MIMIVVMMLVMMMVMSDIFIPCTTWEADPERWSRQSECRTCRVHLIVPLLGMKVLMMIRGMRMIIIMVVMAMMMMMVMIPASVHARHVEYASSFWAWVLGMACPTWGN